MTSSDAVLVSLSFKSIWNGARRDPADGLPVVNCGQFAVTKFDTRYLDASDRRRKKMSCPITTEHFEAVLNTEWLLARKNIPQLLGLCPSEPAKAICLSQVGNFLTVLLRIEDDKNKGKFRRIVLVPHPFPRDVRLLRWLKVNNTHISPVVAVLDTQMMAKSVLRMSDEDLAWVVPKPDSFYGGGAAGAAPTSFDPSRETGRASADAACTMQSLLAMAATCVRNRLEKSAEHNAGSVVDIFCVDVESVESD